MKMLRAVCFYIVKGYADPKHFPKTPEQWWPISGQSTHRAMAINTWSEEKRATALQLIQQVQKGGK